MMDENRWISKKVYLQLINGRFYTGTVIDENSLSITIKDKFNKLVQISKSDLSFLQEEV